MRAMRISQGGGASHAGGNSGCVSITVSYRASINTVNKHCDRERIYHYHCISCHSVAQSSSQAEKGREVRSRSVGLVARSCDPTLSQPKVLQPPRGTHTQSKHTTHDKEPCSIEPGPSRREGLGTQSQQTAQPLHKISSTNSPQSPHKPNRSCDAE